MSVTSKYRRWPQSSALLQFAKIPHEHKVQPKPTKALQLQIANDTNNNVTTKTCTHKTCEVYTQQTQPPPPPQKPTKLIYGTYSKQKKYHKALEANSAGCKNQSKCWCEKQNSSQHLQHILNTSVICWWVTTLGTSMVWSSIYCFLLTFMKLLLKKV